MAENNRRSNSLRDAVPPRSSEAPARSQAEDPLAELARLIGQKGPINDLRRNDRYDDEQYDSPRRFDDRNAGSSVNEPIEDRGATHARYSQRDAAREPSPAMRSPLSAPPRPNMNASRDNSGGYASSRGYREPVESEIFPSLSTDGRADSRYEDDSCYEDQSRYEESNRYEDNTEYERDSRYEADSRHEHDNSRSEGGSDYQDGDYEYDDQGHGHSDEHVYADEADYEGEGYEDEASGGRRRTGFVLVATIFGLAVLGTAVAFGYRAIFGAAIAPSLPPIIKAEDGPNKIVPTANAQGSPGQADTTSADSGEKLVSREEQPVNIQPPASAAPSTTPRMVSTVPVFPDSPRGIGPSSPAAAYPIAPTASGSPAFGLAPATAGVASSTPAPSPPPADIGAAAANQSAQSPATVAAPAPPASAATKKIHTVAIRTDQSDSTDATSTSSTQRVKPAADANAPLSIVPSGGDTAPPAPPATHQHAAPARPAPVNTAAATTNDSAAPGTAGGGYAVQVASQHSEAEVQDSFRALQAKYPDVLGGRQPIIRRADLGSKGIYFRALVGPFASAEEAASMCSNLKAAGGSCLVQKN
jgi:SPOR domain